MAHLDPNIIVMSPQTFQAYGEQRFEAEGVMLMPIWEIGCLDWVGHIMLDGKYCGAIELPNPFPGPEIRVRRDG